MPNYSNLEHKKMIIQDAITSLIESIDKARKQVNKKYLNKEITVYELTNQLVIFDFFEKFLCDNLEKNENGFLSLLSLYENYPFPTKQDFENFNTLRFFLCSMIGSDKLESEFENFKDEGI
jgi:hypothetical protein